MMQPTHNRATGSKILAPDVLLALMAEMLVAAGGKLMDCGSERSTAWD